MKISKILLIILFGVINLCCPKLYAQRFEWVEFKNVAKFKKYCNEETKKDKNEDDFNWSEQLSDFWEEAETLKNKQQNQVQSELKRFLEIELDIEKVKQICAEYESLLSSLNALKVSRKSLTKIYLQRLRDIDKTILVKGSTSVSAKEGSLRDRLLKLELDIDEFAREFERSKGSNWFLESESKMSNGKLLYDIHTSTEGAKIENYPSDPIVISDECQQKGYRKFTKYKALRVYPNLIVDDMALYERKGSNVDKINCDECEVIKIEDFILYENKNKIVELLNTPNVDKNINNIETIGDNSEVSVQKNVNTNKNVDDENLRYYPIDETNKQNEEIKCKIFCKNKDNDFHLNIAGFQGEDKIKLGKLLRNIVLHNQIQERHLCELDCSYSKQVSEIDKQIDDYNQKKRNLVNSVEEIIEKELYCKNQILPKELKKIIDEKYKVTFDDILGRLLKFKDEKEIEINSLVKNSEKIVYTLKKIIVPPDDKSPDDTFLENIDPNSDESVIQDLFKRLREMWHIEVTVVKNGKVENVKGNEYYVEPKVENIIGYSLVGPLFQWSGSRDTDYRTITYILGIKTKFEKIECKRADNESGVFNSMDYQSAVSLCEPCALPSVDEIKVREKLPNGGYWTINKKTGYNVVHVIGKSECRKYERNPVMRKYFKFYNENDVTKGYVLKPNSGEAKVICVQKK